MVDDESIAGKLRQMREAAETMETYLGGGADGVDGFGFMTMAEAGEVGRRAVLAKLNEQAGDKDPYEEA